ncbi:CPBP family intramembrane glutamic endopeptidase [Edaphobacter albus]|uniref:CPBP family intramembrane glutamic endopeptidase n=1 Tax=Edaphobacter sp. 4G125 TaxID=2763071 RepID=UPI0016466773|nr:type II CAAX endopeptidase family protein [Edaphobacter sp. 4G125]QNI35946.1 CPBP family intramembrane metalloprotease [Edaphobacter sp. 4G125]
MNHPSTPPVPNDLSREYSQAPSADAPPPSLPVRITDGPAIVIPAPPPSNAAGPGVPARVPHLGHAILFVSFAGLTLVLSQSILLGLSHIGQKAAASAMHPKLLVAAMAISYLLTLTTSYFFFPLLWLRSFGNGLQWNFDAAWRNAYKLIPIGLITGFAVQGISSLIPVPKSIPMDNFFRTPSDVWLVTAFGTLLGPLFEEVAFRGFLLPAFAIAYDWLSLPKTPAARERWHNTTGLTVASLIFSAIVSSIFFALLHAEQLAHAWAALFVLFCVSLILTLVRIRTRSVASSTLVHAAYNFSVFLTLFIATGGYQHLERMTR